MLWQEEHSRGLAILRKLRLQNIAYAKVLWMNKRWNKWFFRLLRLEYRVFSPSGPNWLHLLIILLAVVLYCTLLAGRHG
jgi:hypothetical protein